MVKDYIKNYLIKIKNEYGIDEYGLKLFEKIIQKDSSKKREVLEIFEEIKEKYGLSFALISLYRQQVESGFVLGDPLNPLSKEEKIIHDDKTQINFIVQWNPDRELRKDRELLKKRGIIAVNIDESKLINFDSKGRPCFLCKHNIELQNPAEILAPIKLIDENFYAGANFAYITNNHFTIMNEKHIKQDYRDKIPYLMNEFVKKTNGYFRVIYNGKAGASILEHEHLQATTEKFPIEDIKLDKALLYEKDKTKVYSPFYYIPVFIVKGEDLDRVSEELNKIVHKWHSIDAENHTENIIAIAKRTEKSSYEFTNFLILRDRRKLAGNGKKGAMASFEVGGNIVLSYEGGKVDERKTFDSCTVETVRSLLFAVSPDARLLF